MKKRKHEHVNLERWLVSYADFITLLFAFFVVMYAISQADLAKFQKVAASMKKAFNGGTAGQGAVQSDGSAGGNSVNLMDDETVPGGRVLNMPEGKTNTSADPNEELQKTKELLEESISLETGVSELSEKMQILYDSRGLIVRLAVKDFFPEGQTEVPQDLRPLLEKIGKILNKTDRPLRIEGHTDPSEAKVAGYPSDWELSAARAGWVARYWITRLGMDPRRIAIAGYGHFHPLTQTKEDWFRGGNRRIEILVLNSRYDKLEKPDPRTAVPARAKPPADEEDEP